MEAPIKASGHLQILYGNLAPDGSVAKITGKEGLQFRGPARVFDSEEDMIAVVYEDPQQLKVGMQTFSPGHPRWRSERKTPCLLWNIDLRTLEIPLLFPTLRCLSTLSRHLLTPLKGNSEATPYYIQLHAARSGCTKWY